MFVLNDLLLDGRDVNFLRPENVPGPRDSMEL